MQLKLIHQQYKNGMEGGKRGEREAEKGREQRERKEIHEVPKHRMGTPSHLPPVATKYSHSE